MHSFTGMEGLPRVGFPSICKDIWKNIWGGGISPPLSAPSGTALSAESYQIQGLALFWHDQETLTLRD